jgi:hypothetical protein
MTVVRVETDDDGGFSTLVMNTREDLRHDFEYFIGEAKSHNADIPETMLLHQRFLRAAVLFLFAYADAIANGVLHSLLDSQQVEKLRHWPLDKKIEVLHEKSISSAITKPNYMDAKKLRNLFVHFTPDRDAEAFEKLSFVIVEDAANELSRWMTEMESALGLPRHDDSEEIMCAFDGLGIATKRVSSNAE